jgi:hypothetical protein
MVAALGAGIAAGRDGWKDFNLNFWRNPRQVIAFFSKS